MVIGSKPEIKFPDIVPSKIYAANGAIERVSFYKKKNCDIYVVSIIGNMFLNFNSLISKIKFCAPNELITTNGKIDIARYFEKDFLRHIIYRSLNNKGRDLQKIYFSNFTLRKADLGLIFSNRNIFYGSLRFFYNILIKKRKPMGLTTGCLALLMALHENKSSNVVVVGISLSGGKHFYKSDRNYPDYRGWADAYLIKRLPNFCKSRIFTTDSDFSKIAGVKLIEN